MIILLRGHIRNAFDTTALYDLLTALHAISPLRIYIHTWGILQNSLSWRPIRTDTSEISETAVRAYFRDLEPCIRKILIDPDGSVPLLGSTEGYMPTNRMPKRGWKNMWAGMYRIMTVIREECGEDELVLNTRFDVCSNSCKFPIPDYIRLYRTMNAVKPNKIYFLRSELFNGCDNYFIGPLKKMNDLVTSFHVRLDEVLASHPVTHNHERYVMLEAARQTSGSTK
jgi:hypothetical protein